VTCQACSLIIRTAEQYARNHGGWKADLHTMTFSDLYAADLLPTINHVFVPALALIKKMIDYKFGPGQLVETFGYPKLVKYCADKGGKQRGTVLHTDGADIAYTISLSPPSHYGGGGTFFKELGGSIRPAQGEVGNAWHVFKIRSCSHPLHSVSWIDDRSCSHPLHSVSWIRYIGNSLLWIGAAQGL
jgi:hypothetical protein